MISADKLWNSLRTSQTWFATGSGNLSWQYSLRQVDALAKDLSERQISSVALYFDDAAYFAMALLACVQAKIAVYIPGNMAFENRRWLESTVDIYLADQTVDDLAVTALLIADWPQLAKLVYTGNFSHNIDIFMQTSGSTGATKIIRKNWQALFREAKTLAMLMPEGVISGQTVVLGNVSTQHMYGLSFRIMLSLYLNLPIYRQRLQFPEILLLASRSQKNVIWVSSPTLLHSLQPSYNVTLTNSCVKAIISSGGGMRNDCKVFLQNCICPYVMEVYGSTETGSIAFRLDQPYWQFLPSVDYKLVEGGISIRSAWCIEEQTVADSVVEYEQGFELLGRLDRIIKLADKRISLVAIENQLLVHDWVADVHVVKHPQSSHLAAWVALNNAGIKQWRQLGRKQVIKKLKDFLSTYVDKIALPRHWRFTTRLPRNEQSKLNQQDIKKALLQPITDPIILAEEVFGDDEYQLSFQVPLDLIYFNGHFDQFHLVPGVIQLKWILNFLTRWLWIEESPSQIENLKFQYFLRPADVVEMIVKRDQIRQKITFSCMCGGRKISTGRLVINHREGKTG